MSDQPEQINEENAYSNAEILKKTPFFEGNAATNKPYLFLTSLGIKPVSVIDCPELKRGGPEEVAKNTEEIMDLLGQLGLKSSLKPESLEIVVSTSQDNIEEFNNTQDPAQRGRLLGYPKTAVEAFAEATRQEQIASESGQKEPFTQDPWILSDSQAVSELTALGYPQDFIKKGFILRLSTQNFKEEAAELYDQYKMLQKFGLITDKVS